MHPSLTLEKRIAAELASYDGQMSVFADDMKGNIVAVCLLYTSPSPRD